MHSEADSSDLIERYLLGELSEQEQASVEQRFSDESFFEQALAVENELFYDYSQGLLAPRAREQFEKRLLITENDRRKLATARALLDRLGEAPVRAREEEKIASGLGSWWRSSLSWIQPRTPAMRLAFASALVLLIAVGMLIVRVALRPPFGGKIAQKAGPVAEPSAVPTRQSVPATPSPSKVEIAGQKPTPAPVPAPGPKGPPRPAAAGAVASLILTPGLLRGSAEPKRIVLTPANSFLRLQLVVKAGVNAGDEYQSYRAVLRTAEGKQVFQQRGLRPHPSGSSPSVTLNLPAKTIPAGDYELTLSGQTEPGAFEELADYYFTVLRK